MPQMARCSETYDVSSTYRSGIATLTLDPDGIYNFFLKGDMSESTAKRNPNHKIAEGHITTEMLKAYNNNEKAFLSLHDKGNISTDLSYSIDNNVSKQEYYQWKTFSLPKPTLKEVTLLVLEEQALLSKNAKGNGSDLENEKDAINSSLHERTEAWEEIQSLFNAIETSMENKTNSIYKREYESRCKTQNDIINGEDDVIEAAFEEFDSKLDIPFNINLEYKYSKAKGEIEVDIELVDNIESLIPLFKASTKASGQISIKSKAQNELAQDVSTCQISLIYYIAKAVFNISPHIKKCCVSLYTNCKIQGLCWISFNRDKIKSLDFKYLNPLLDFNNWINISNIKYLKVSTRLEPLDAATFNKLINKIR